jgi:hypothetical protein
LLLDKVRLSYIEKHSCVALTVIIVMMGGWEIGRYLHMLFSTLSASQHEGWMGALGSHQGQRHLLVDWFWQIRGGELSMRR